MQGQRGVVGWTLVRIVFGLSLALGHGLPKVTGNMAGFAEGVAKLGFPFPLVFAWAAALSELLGGLLVAVGLFTRPAATLGAFTLAVALYRHRVDPFGTMEKALLFFSVMVAVVLAGPGPWSLDAKVRRRL
ncbi:DoxX family protein [Stigmatella aurantiaca]|uniref:DoxD-like family protein n=1 Tax=Stigmatella aurantiaca (strain DW4/3-1) TaxID=378806 RepID=Q091G9_STIAD|nr:DoxX family protein [Stigmatella aurantiaca]ADO73684.1 DoxD-like family protein [Stigmatella aurantiaca DW4/3-1]EAU66378.1 membrane protein [Stigmatella aurantiaca DW4/3-1]